MRVWRDLFLNGFAEYDQGNEYAGVDDTVNLNLTADTYQKHIVAALDPATGTCHVIAAYVPDPAIWQPGFRTRRLS